MMKAAASPLPPLLVVVCAPLCGRCHPPGAAQRFLAVFSVIFPHFRPAAIGSSLTTIAPK